MNILFDEGVPWPLSRELSAHDCRTAQQLQWNRIKNGELLSLAEPQFDLFLTCDQNLRYQQNLTGRSIAILELSTNKLRRLVSAAQLIRDTIASIKPGEFRRLEIP
ncbi:MAG TPA: hypothetical protein VK993_15370 [Chthoniobacterales bacterium]|nr:hypothetical protein [Chthoniobacterales bacterium]